VSAELDKLAAVLDAYIDKSITAVAVEAQATLVEGTPIDTGWARNNWLMSLDAPATEPAGSPDNVGSASAASQQGIAIVISSFSHRRHGNIYIANNVPYIGRLNDGYSPQAPAGYVETALDTAVAVVEANPPKGGTY